MVFIRRVEIKMLEKEFFVQKKKGVIDWKG